jgi:hypothetical protein
VTGALPQALVIVGGFSLFGVVPKGRRFSPFRGPTLLGFALIGGFIGIGVLL